MVCRAYRNFCINAVSSCPCQLDLSNSVDLSDPYFAFPSWLNIHFWVSRLHVKDSFLSDCISLCCCPSISKIWMKVRALAFQVIVACIFWCLYFGFKFYSETLLLRLFYSFNSSSGSQVGAQVKPINSCFEKLFLSFFWVGVMWLQAGHTQSSFAMIPSRWASI